jgi:hypothetical protein
MTWPESLRESPCGKPYRLYESDEEYAFYYTGDIGFGFAHAKEVLVRRALTDPSIVLVEVRELSGNSWGVTKDGRPRTPKDPSTLTWLHVCSYWFRSLDHLRATWDGKARPLTPRQIERIVRKAQQAGSVARSASRREKEGG